MAETSPERFTTAAAFRASLEDRLKREAAARGLPPNTLRLQLVMERQLARLFAAADPPWLLKGGYAMELRYRPRAWAARDLDLAVPAADAAGPLAARLERVRDQLQAAAEADAGDFLRYAIAATQTELQGAPPGGARFTCGATLAGRPYGRFHLAVGLGDAVLGEPERLTGDTLLAFAGIPPASVLAVPRAQQFAEKAHAHTSPRAGRTNTRTKDLVDLVLLIDRGGLPPPAELRTAVAVTFGRRNTHPVSAELPPPPAAWAADYTAMAAEVGLPAADLAAGFGLVAAFWREHVVDHDPDGADDDTGHRRPTA